MKMEVTISNQSKHEELMDELVHSFQTHFCLKERQWFGRCDGTLHQYTSDFMIILYTLPYAFGKLTYSDQCLSKSTCPNERDYWSYDRVHILGYERENKYVLEKSIHYSPSFPHIHHLVTSLPCNTNFWSCISSINQFIPRSITVGRKRPYTYKYDEKRQAFAAAVYTNHIRCFTMYYDHRKR
jgi:hypothetical protein